VGLFCQMSVATPPVDCAAALGNVRDYLRERSLSVPPVCEGGPSAPPPPGALPGPPWVELALPQVAGWQRGEAQDEGPERGFIVEYDFGGRIAATVYVYRAGVPAIRRDPALLMAQVQGALSGMRQAQQAGRYDAVRELGPASMSAIGSAPNAHPAAYQRVMITREGTELPSETYVTTHRGFFFKLRISLFAEPSATTDRALSALLNQLAQSIHE